MADVKEIQVCGVRVFNNLKEVCQDYLQCLADGVDREKINFCIILANGKIKHITFRQDGEKVITYGDFEGLPNALEWAQDKK